MEPAAEPVEAVSAPVETGDIQSEAAQPEAAAFVPAGEEANQPAPAAPVEVEAETAPVMEEIPEKAVEAVPTSPAEEALVPVEMTSGTEEAALDDARQALNQGQPSQAVELLSGLIRQNVHLADIIKDLKDALNRFPEDIDIWVSLGDAHYRSNDLQEALNAYTKAEELVRQ
jgi:cytochrome c-type biogenesis protein CcmH/NrfG